MRLLRFSARMSRYLLILVTSVWRELMAGWILVLMSSLIPLISVAFVLILLSASVNFLLSSGILFSRMSLILAWLVSISFLSSVSLAVRASCATLLDASRDLRASSIALIFAMLSWTSLLVAARSLLSLLISSSAFCRLVFVSPRPAVSLSSSALFFSAAAFACSARL